MQRSLASVQKKPIAKTVAEEIRNSILAGLLLPGERLKEKELCQELNVSPTPLREAFRILQAQNLIEYNHYVGVSVVELTRKYIEDMWETKMLLEPEASALAADYADEAQISAMEASIDRMESLKDDDSLAFIELDNEFHHLLAEASGNLELGKTVDGIYDRTMFSRSLSVGRGRGVSQSVLEHREILKTIREHNAEAARKATEKHLSSSLVPILESFDSEKNQSA